jgi:pimeloyl-ACP methyl ester carboxylesterase
MSQCRRERRLNALPQFTTEIDGLAIHFLHVRSQHADALPLIVTHGWPGSIIEQLKLIGPLTNPTAHGGSEADAFHVVIPSLPGHGFSAKPTATGSWRGRCRATSPEMTCSTTSRSTG